MSYTLYIYSNMQTYTNRAASLSTVEHGPEETESSVQPADPMLSMRRIQRGKPLKRLDLQLQVLREFGQSWAEVTSPRSLPLWGLPHASQFASTWKAPSNIKGWSTSIFFYTFVLFLILLPCMHTECSGTAEEELYLQRP